jgi:serine/threonine protein kinase/Tol biopolymer transport system component
MSAERQPLDPELWRRIGVVLDRVREAEPAQAASVLAQACDAEGLRRDQVEPYLAAERDAAATPEHIDKALLDAAVRAHARETRAPVLSPGERLGHYEIVDPVGAGGMAEVYRARDTRLGRSVAIKILQTHLATRSENRARFEREARAISGLSHPHICTLHDIGTYERPSSDQALAGDRETLDFLVMELLQGETLAARLARGPLPIADVLRYAGQIADALAAAHRAGITHRDLKPANVMLTPHGVKLLDFGVAALRPSGEVLADATAAALTADGAIVGTLNYMAPEQLQGKPVDGRADLFALGVIVYEMLTGRQAFAADSAAGVVAAILERGPEPIAALRPDVPPALERALARCLERSPDDRWQSAADLAAHFQSIDQAPMAASSLRRTEAPPLLPSGRRVAYRIAVAIAVSAVGLTAYLLLPRPVPVAPDALYRFIVPPPAGMRYDRGLSISPDGRRIAFSAIDERDKRMLWVHPLDGGASQRIEGTEGGLYPFWSPDGQQLGFFADNRLKGVDLASGRVRIIADAGLGGGGTWNADGAILFASNDVLGPTRIQRVAASGGRSTQVTDSPDLGVHSWPHFLPDGRHYLHLRINRGESGIYAGRLDADEPKPILTAPVKELLDDRVETENSRAVYADGHMFYLRGRVLYAQPFDPLRFALSGEAVRLADAVDQEAPGRSSFDATSNGVLAYIAPPVRDTVQYVWLDAGGKEVGRLGAPGPYRTFAISPDGRSVLVDRQDLTMTEPRSVVRFDVASGTSTPVRRAGAYPVWSPDGTRFAHRGGRGRPLIRVTSSDGSDPEGKGLGLALNAYAADWSLDGRFLVGVAIRPETSSRDLFAVELETGQVTFLVESRFEESDPRLSPDGQWLAYAAANEANRWEVYVRPFGRAGGVQRVSPRGGRFPRWTDNGRALLFVEPDGTLIRTAIDFGPSAVNAKTSEKVFRHDALTYEYNLPTPNYPYDVAGGRFLLRVPVQTAPPQPINVITNWQSLVRR